MTDRHQHIVAFIQAAENLKNTLRSGRTSTGRQESTAEHSWRLCLLAILLERDMPTLDVGRLLKLCIIHDLAEAVTGDIPAPDQKAGDHRRAREREAMEALCAALPDDLRESLLDLWEDYAEPRTAEARFAKGLDKIETLLQHAIGQNEPGFDYAYNLAYGRTETTRHELLQKLRMVADEMTRKRLMHG